ncbi:unnamed protein product [Arctia plantaginis]|uniref:Attacin C-terminal domain-containing protein n=1 Tax=Arctia plantaginis TaxID=874455 RepID=A0A8S0YQM0_ARCPL|nr:unnamed protein product [Arctia plantaginis]
MVTVMKETIPGFGSKLNGAGHATLFNNDKHNIGANAFISKNMPNIPNVTNINTVGGGLDYTYNPTSTVNFSAGFKKFDSPLVSSGWQPNFGLTFGRSF